MNPKQVKKTIDNKATHNSTNQDTSPVIIVAEIGINHNGDMDLARDSIRAAAEAGADSVKFQNYKTEDFITDKNLMMTYKSQGETIEEPQYNVFKRCELSREQLFFLKQECDSAGILFHSTPTNVDGIQDLKDVGCKLLKNGSDYLTNLSLVRAMGETGLKTILSTGRSTLAEIDEAVRVFQSTGNDKLMLLHCTSSYPTPPEEVNLSRIKTLQQCFGVNVGFSDHTDGITASIGATILGVRWIEKHFTISKDLAGPDHWFSMDPNELSVFSRSIREAEKMLGTTVVAPTTSETLARRDFRLSCVASRDLSEGDLIELSDVVFHRPGDGIPPSQADFLYGLRLTRSIQYGEQFSNEFFSP